MIKRKVQTVKLKVKTKSLKRRVLYFSFAPCALNFALCALSFTLLYGCQDQKLYRDKRVMMGSFVEVVSDHPQAAGIVFSEIQRVEDALSRYKPESEVSLLNKNSQVRAGSDMFFVIGKAKEFWLASEGAFDITVAPLLELWGFSDRNYRFPADEQIKKTLALVGANKIIFLESDNVIKFSLPEMKIDLGAIAAGYAVDCGVKALRQAGIKNCLINAGGEIYCLGTKFKKPWTVAVRHPRLEGRFSRSLRLSNQAVSTSGDYENYFMNNKRRYAHILDPRTGYPADSGVASATVIAPDCLTADALATAIFVLGKEKGLALVKRFAGVEAEIIESKD
jgi:thiamine biosynthesis lipoprotein